MIVKVAINVSSGKIVCGNDFRDQYSLGDIEFNLNEIVGIKRTIEEYGKRGLIHGFCGNSCPSIYLDGNKISIVSCVHREENTEFGRLVGGICTDLWWYSIADYDDYVSRGGIIDDRLDTVLCVEPGRYVLSHDLDSAGCFDDLILFATIDRSDEEIIAWKMPEEGVVEAVFDMLPDKYKQRASDSTLNTGFSIRSEFDYYNDLPKQIGYSLFGWVFDGDVSQFVSCKFTSDQIVDHAFVAKSIIDEFNSEKDREKFLKVSKILVKRAADKLREKLRRIKK